jgi:hypothetical protein
MTTLNRTIRIIVVVALWFSLIGLIFLPEPVASTQIHTADCTSIGLSITIDTETRRRTAEFKAKQPPGCTFSEIEITANGRTVKMTYDEFIKRVGLSTAQEDRLND